MELRQLTTFIRVAQFQSFSKAAASLGYSQSAVTVQIRMLEEELKVRLFDRMGKRVSLTGQGRVFLDSALSILQDVNRAKLSLAGEDEVLRGQLSATYGSLKKSTGKVNAFLLSRCLTNCLTRPHFIAYEIGRKPLSVRLSELLGAMKVAWTSLEWKTEEKNDAVIFQFYRPRVKYK